MRTKKILTGLLGLILLVVAATAFFSGDVLFGSLVLSAPLVVPAIKAESISDSEKLAAELNEVFGKMSTAIKQAIADEYKEKGAISLTEIDAKLKSLGINSTTLKEINDAIQEHGLKFDRLASGADAKLGFKESIKKAFSAEGLAGKIADVFGKGSGMVDVLKAVGTITTGHVTTDTGGNALLDMLNADEMMDIRLTTPFIEEFANTGKTSKPVYSYVDYIPGEGDVNFIAEGNEKPQLDLDITVKSETPVKAAGYEILTDESIQDIPRLESNAKNLLFKKYLLKRQNGILFGDGIGANPLGITAIASAFNPASWVGAKVKSPNLYDAIVAAANMIFTTVSYTDDVEYYPNVCFVNPGDFSAWKLQKDLNNGYLFPSVTMFNNKELDGIKIVPKNKIPAGKILIGDFTKLNIIDYIAYSVRIGWINDQFIKNLFTMLGEGRFFVYVKNLDQRAFVYDDIDTIIAAIEEVQA